MLLSDTSLEQTLRAALRSFNIRTLEQLLEIGNSGRRLRLTAEALGVDREALRLQISKLREQHPDVAPPPAAPARRYPTGHRVDHT